MSFQVGIAVCRGVRPEWATMPIRNLPHDTLSVRRRMRAREVMTVTMKTAHAFTCYALGPAGGSHATATELELVRLLGSNVRQAEDAS